MNAVAGYLLAFALYYIINYVFSYVVVNFDFDVKC